MKKKILTRMVEQYLERHKKLPEKIIIHPLALVSLGLRRSVAPVWNGIRVECEEVAPEASKKDGSCLGVCIAIKRKESVLVSFDC
jgi:hypothetical protein